MSAWRGTWINLLAFVLANALLAAPQHGVVKETYGGREVIVFVPSKLPARGARALVVVLHGGMGNASRIENGQSEHPLNMDEAAEKYGFVVAYLNGSKAARAFSEEQKAWNAGGGCCGLPARENVDDVGYIRDTVQLLGEKYGIDPKRVFGLGHSNGALMTQRVVCEAGIYAAAVPISGPLNLTVTRCPAAAGRRILAIHGADDQNVPVAGGYGSKGISNAHFESEEHSRQVFTASEAAYTILIVPNADHRPEHIEEQLQRTEHVTIAEKAAQFFGLTKPAN